MKKYLLYTTCLILLIFWPIQAQEIADVKDVHLVPLTPARLNTASETSYLNELAIRGLNLDRQGLLIESLDGSMVFADHLSDTGFNPASVIKVATSFTALQALGPDYRFKTAFYSAGTINKKTRTLKGDLILKATGNPVLATADVTRMVRQLTKAGIGKVTGSLIIDGPFTYASYYTSAKAVRALQTRLRTLGIRVAGPVKYGTARGDLQASHESQSLREILFLQNAHSSNPIAERLGEALGGPHAVERFLVEHVGLEASQITITRTSGLDYNRITAKGTVKLFRTLVQWLEARGMQPQDILPVAGVDPGTLHARFNSDDYRGAVVGKTGSLPGTDGGVSALAGILYTRDQGPVLFAIFNNKGPVSMYRRLQDSLIKDMMTEFGGQPMVSASSHKSNN
jgi:D-alanyl-D-alanine carboxypeptidase/D-alanyl-D-alanine-endopeptidase (penicillin-binding protein 4)